MSAIRGGWEPICIDAFADADLARIAHVMHVPNYPRGIAKAVRDLPSISWIFTGGLENRPRLVQGLAEKHRLLGNTAQTLRSIRDPFFWTRVLADTGLPTLAVSRFDHPPAPNGRWLRKPIRSAGGQRIQRWDQQLPTSRHFFFQEHGQGDSYSATFLAIPTSHKPDVQLVGLVRHFADHAGLHATQFGWCGGITQPDIPDAAKTQLIRIARLLADHCGLVGCWGIDFLWDGETVWPVEINPRYTATGELWDAVHRRSLIADHIEACNANPIDQRNDNPRTVAAKLIVYAPKSLRVPHALTESVMQPKTSQAFQLPDFADIPHADTTIAAAWPVCTVLASAESTSQTLAIIEERLAWLSEQFQRSGQNIAWRCQF